MATSTKKEKKTTLIKKANKKPILHKNKSGRRHFEQFKAPEFEKTRNETADRALVPVATTNTKALTPAAGIYSPGWIQSITNNMAPLFDKLSLELRLKVWEYAIDNIGDSRTHPGEIGIIEPFKFGNKFRDEKAIVNAPAQLQGMNGIGKKLNALYLICKQAYFEIHGSGLFYRRKHFKFSSANRMMDYLNVINPISRNAIKTMELQFWIRSGITLRFATHLTFPMINSMENLQSLHLSFTIDETSEVSDKLIEYLEYNKGLKNLKGIRDFRFELGTPDFRCYVPYLKGVNATVAKILKKYEEANALKLSAKI